MHLYPVDVEAEFTDPPEIVRPHSTIFMTFMNVIKCRKRADFAKIVLLTFSSFSSF